MTLGGPKPLGHHASVPLSTRQRPEAFQIRFILKELVPQLEASLRATSADEDEGLREGDDSDLLQGFGIELGLHLTGDRKEIAGRGLVASRHVNGFKAVLGLEIPVAFEVRLSIWGMEGVIRYL